MKRKYKIYLALWAVGTNVININLFVLYLIPKNPEDQLLKAVIAFIVHLIIVCLGAVYIGRRSKRDPITVEQ